MALVDRLYGYVRAVSRYRFGLTPFSLALSFAALVVSIVDPSTISDALVRALLALLLGVGAVRLALSDRKVRSTIEKLERLSREDALTTLWNQADFRRRLDEEVNRAQRYRRRLSLIVMDVDGLKRLNDEEGHQRGDELLATFGRSLRAALRASDAGFRIGGDEFAVLLPETDRAEAASVAARLQEALLSSAMARFGATVSVGVAEFPTSGMAADDLMRAADKAMYAEKELARGRRDAARRADALPPEFQADPVRVATQRRLRGRSAS
jgi:diguanylate cyclase (GGDEF)-like protein